MLNFIDPIHQLQTTGTVN